MNSDPIEYLSEYCKEHGYDCIVLLSSEREDFSSMTRLNKPPDETMIPLAMQRSIASLCEGFGCQLPPIGNMSPVPQHNSAPLSSVRDVLGESLQEVSHV